jgi:hypothetical protein
MSPKSTFTAKSFDEKYGDLVASEFSHLDTPRLLRNALAARKPSINVTDGMLKVWFSSYRLPAGTIKIGSADELEAHCGAYLPVIAAEHATAYKLQRALLARMPPVSVTEGILKVWLKRRFDCRPIDSAGHLELEYGDIIRESGKSGIDPEDLRLWLRAEHKVDASCRTCMTWSSREWSTAHKLSSIIDVEEAVGDRLRLAQYSDLFTDDKVTSLAQQLADGQPPVYLAMPYLLLQWHAKYHPGH